jgi:hypothetical protein
VLEHLPQPRLRAGQAPPHELIRFRVFEAVQQKLPGSETPRSRRPEQVVSADPVVPDLMGEDTGTEHGFHHTARASASPYGLDRGDRPGRHQRWTRSRVVSPVAGSRRTTTLMLPPCSTS